MHPAIAGQKRVKAVLGRGVGARGLPKGKKIKKSVSGNTVSENIAQVNASIVEKGSKTLAELGFTPKAKEKKIEGEKKEEPKGAEKKK